MKSNIKQSLVLIIALLLAIFFIIITIKDIDFNRIAGILEVTNYFWIFISMVISIITYWIRAIRWNILLKSMGYQHKVSSGFWAIALGYFTSLIIPRSGEISRSTCLYKMENIPFEKSFGTIVLERVIDFFFLILFYCLATIFNYKTFLHFINLSYKKNSIINTNYSLSSKYYIIIVVISIITILIGNFWKRLLKSVLFTKSKKFILGLWVGIQSISKVKEKCLFTLYSFTLWICYFFMTFVVLLAFPETKHFFSFSEGLFLLVAGSLGMILPIFGGLAYPYTMTLAFAAIYIEKGGNLEEGRAIGNYFGIIFYIAHLSIKIIFGIVAIYRIGRVKL